MFAGVPNDSQSVLKAPLFNFRPFATKSLTISECEQIMRRKIVLATIMWIHLKSRHFCRFSPVSRAGDFSFQLSNVEGFWRDSRPAQKEDGFVLMFIALSAQHFRGVLVNNKRMPIYYLKPLVYLYVYSVAALKGHPAARSGIEKWRMVIIEILVINFGCFAFRVGKRNKQTYGKPQLNKPLKSH